MSNPQATGLLVKLPIQKMSQDALNQQLVNAVNYLIGELQSFLSGSVTVSEGGTGLASLISGDVYVGNGASPMVASSINDNGTIVNIAEPMELSGTGLTTYTSPQAAAIPTKINVPNFTLPAFSQYFAFGLTAACPDSARAILICDARISGTQEMPISVLDVTENYLIGIGWNNSQVGIGDQYGLIKCTRTMSFQTAFDQIWIDGGGAGGVTIGGGGSRTFEGPGTINATGYYINGVPVGAWVTAPVHNTSAGTAGQIATDGTYMYFCVATNTWIRILGSTPF